MPGRETAWTIEADAPCGCWGCIGADMVHSPTVNLGGGADTTCSGQTAPRTFPPPSRRPIRTWLLASTMALICTLGVSKPCIAIPPANPN